MKLLKTKKYNIDRVYLGLLNILPNRYQTIKEIETSSEILDLLEPLAKDHFNLLKEVDKINEKYAGTTDKDSNWTDLTLEIASLNKRIKIKEDQDKEKNIALELEDEEFNQFFQFSEKWGKEWFMRIKEFLDFRKDINEANTRPKKSK